MSNISEAFKPLLKQKDKNPKVYDSTKKMTCCSNPILGITNDGGNTHMCMNCKKILWQKHNIFYK